MGDHRLPADLRGGHPALRARCGRIQHPQRFHGRSHCVRCGEPHLRFGAEPRALVFGRIVQGAGGAAIPALASVSVTKVLPPGERGAALGLIVSSVGVGAAVGPILGGAVGALAGWHYLFVGTLILTAALIPAALYVLPGDSPEDSRGFDLPGGILLGLAAGLFLFGITRGQVSGFGSAGSWGASPARPWQLWVSAGASGEPPSLSCPQRSSRTGLTSPPLSSGTSACSPTCLRSSSFRCSSPRSTGSRQGRPGSCSRQARWRSP